MDKSVVILGGGISGLSAGFFLQQRGYDVKVIESKEQPGGNIEGFQKEGFTCECGPNTILLNNIEFVSLLESLGLWDKVIFADDINSKRRFIVKNDNPRRVVPNPISILKSNLLSLRGMLRLLKEPFIRKIDDHPISVADYMTKRMGKEVYENFINPFMAGIYAGKPTNMSMKYTFPLLYTLEQKHGSIIKGMYQHMKGAKERAKLPKQKIFTLPGGLSLLPKTIGHKLGKGFINEARITNILKTEGKYQVNYTKDNKEHSHSSSHVISTIPAHSLSHLLDNFDSKLSASLTKVHYAPIAILHLGFRKQDLSSSPKGFGILVPETEKKIFLGILLNSDIFDKTAPDEKCLMTVFIGGDRNPDLCSMDEDRLTNLVISEIKEIMQIKTTPIFTHLLVNKKAIPQFGLQHGEIVNEISDFENKYPGFHISGNFVQGISVSDCVKRSYELSLKVAEFNS